MKFQFDPKALKTLVLGSFAVLAACTAQPPSPGPAPQPKEIVEKPRLSKIDISRLPGWHDDNKVDALTAFLESCKRWRKSPKTRSVGPKGMAGKVEDWLIACRQAERTPNNRNEASRFFQKEFSAYRVSDAKPENDLFTGYYEPELQGARVKSGAYVHPIYGRPDDLVLVSLGAWRNDLKGERIAGRVKSGRLRPYDTRRTIRTGSIDGVAPVLAWVDDPIALFFLHIQGSGRIALRDGSILRAGYDGHNGHPYFAIGRHLVKSGHLTKENVSLQSIRDWLIANPADMNFVMDKNASYVFFKELNGAGPLGAMAAPLTPGRSLAIDRRHMPLGAPVWVDIDYKDEQGRPLQRLMVMQDTGGAIRGPVRGDVFWGAGETAEWLAGHMKASGRYYLMVPKSVIPSLR